MAAITITDLENAKLDADHIANIATSIATTATDRLGNVKQTIAGAVASIAAINSRGEWVTASSYLVKDLVSNSGTWYMCILAHTSSSSFATDAASKWRVYQGVTSGDLAAPTGSSLVGYMPAGVGAVATDVQGKLRENVSVLEFIPVSEHAAIKAGSSTFNCTPYVQAAVNASFRVHFPAGRYWFSTSRVNLRSGSYLYGDGRQATIIVRAFDVVTASGDLYGSEGVFTAQSSSATTYIDDIYIGSMGFDGLNDTMGYNSFGHLVVLSGTRNAIIEKCGFVRFRGDGVYAASGNRAAIERHNENLTIHANTFDGVNNMNRNGLSCIDVDGANITNNLFKNIGGGAGLSTSVGCIDFERNTSGRAYNNTRAVNITGNRFLNTPYTNTGAITVFSTDRTSGNSTVDQFNIKGNWIENCFWGAVIGGLSLKRSNGESEFAIISSNTFKNCVRSVRATGSFIKINSNKIYNDPAGSTTYPGQIDYGVQSEALGKTYQGEICGNRFIGVGFGGDACISIGDANGLKIDDNFFEDCYAAIHFRSKSTELITRTISSLKIRGNTFSNVGRFTSGLVAVSFFRQNTTMNTAGDNQLINANCEYLSNTINHGVIRHPGGTNPAIFPEMDMVVPATGTWDVGKTSRLTVVSAGSFRSVCSVGGTFGTLAGVTADAVNASVTLTNVVDTAGVLRAGHYIAIGDSPTARKILFINGTTVTLAIAFSGTTGTGLAVSWTPPTFISA